MIQMSSTMKKDASYSLKEVFSTYGTSLTTLKDSLEKKE